jgi:flagellar hook-associated protein 1 FlgK
MQSTFAGIEIGKRGILAHNIGLKTVGHNMSNASTEGYSRQRVHLQAFDPIYRPQLNSANTPGQIGQGTVVERITRVRDQILEGRIIQQADSQGYWEARDKYIRMVEKVYNEPSDSSVRTLMDRFWQGWQELSNFPDQGSARQAVIQRGKALIEGIQQRYQSLDRIRTMLNDEVEAAVERVNELADKIAALNEEIVKVKAAGDNPNDLMDQRDLLVNDLSKIINVTVDKRDPNEFSVHTSGYNLVQGKEARSFQLRPDPQNEGYSDVVWSHSGEEVQLNGGKLAAYRELRDQDVRQEIQNLDNMTINFVDLVNEIHRDGQGLNGQSGVDFFQEYPRVVNAQGNYDRNGDGDFDSSYIFRITGQNQLNAQQQIGISGTMQLSGPDGNVAIDYNPTDTVQDVLKRINNSDAEVVARLNRENRLSLKASPAANEENPDFVIRHVEDSGQFLAGYAGILQDSGAENAYDWDQANAVLGLRGGDLEYSVAPLQNPSGWIEMNQEVVNNPASIAAGFPGAQGEVDPGDGSAAQEIAALRNNPVMVGQTSTFDDYFADSVAEIGLKGEEAERALETQDTIMKDLTDMRQSISGVNIDEEVAQMIKFQHGYTAAARFVTTMDEMLNVIINRMGV